MKTGGRVQAAIDVLEDVLERRTPANMALRDWGKAHRFAGSKDRNAIGDLVHDVLRKRQSLAWQMDEDTPRALAIAAMSRAQSLTAQDLMAAFAADKFAPQTLSQEEARRLDKPVNLSSAPEWVQADVPEWLWPAFENNFAYEAVNEGQALTERPPLDLRANTLKATRADMLEKLASHNPKPCRISPVGIRFAASDERFPNIQGEAAYNLGEVEIQDEGSQIISQLVAAKSGEIILDYCAGGGGKSLALAAEMMGSQAESAPENHSVIHAFDIDKRRLTPLYQRAMRAGATCINICEPPENSLSSLRGRCDRVVIDAPCTGVGTWRRKPDAKWRLRQDALDRRITEQHKILRAACEYVRPGGYLFYMTCSMLAEENEAQIYSFLDDRSDFQILSAGEVWEEKFGVDGLKPWSTDGCSVTLTPAATDTDGFYFAVMQRGDAV